MRTLITLVFLASSGVYIACGDGASKPCEQLVEQCEACPSELARAQCQQAVSLNLQETCQELLSSGTYEATGVECTSD